MAERVAHHERRRTVALAVVTGALGVAIMHGSQVDAMPASKAPAVESESVLPKAAPSACAAIGGEISDGPTVSIGVGPESTKALLGWAGPEAAEAEWTETTAHVRSTMDLLGYASASSQISIEVGATPEAPFTLAEAEAAATDITARLGDELDMATAAGDAYQAQDLIATIIVKPTQPESSTPLDCSTL